MNLIDKKIVRFIKEHHVLTLATFSDSQPYCANCFYAYEESGGRFIFTSDEETRHIQEALCNENIAGSVVLETKIVGKIQGIQFTGKLSPTPPEEEAFLRKIYLKRFPFAAIKQSRLWLLEPDFIKLTDNRLGFGKKIIWRKKA